MAHGIVHRFRGGTREQYEAALAHVHPSDGSLPEGQVLHVSGATDDGWIVIAVHDSAESWQRFRDQTLLPGLQQLGGSGFAAPPEETEFQVHTNQQG